MSDGQLEAQSDGAAAVSLVAGFPATTQTITQVVTAPSGCTALSAIQFFFAYYYETVDVHL